MTIAVSEAKCPKEVPGELTELLRCISKSVTSRKYYFSNTADLHTFQAAVTGFTVLFDGLVASFTISRRRTVVPLYKKWEASQARLQILRRDKVVELAAFFEDFSHCDCLNFILKATDSFESYNKSGNFCIRLADAKFALPKGGDESSGTKSNRFVCLDMPAFPEEHDDITITFDSESDRDKFARTLPAPVKSVSRLGTVKR